MNIKKSIQQSNCLELIPSRSKEFKTSPNSLYSSLKASEEEEFSTDREDKPFETEDFLEAIFDDAPDAQEFPIPLIEAILLPNGEIIFEQLENLSL